MPRDTPPGHTLPRNVVEAEFKAVEPVGLYAVSLGELMALDIPNRPRHLAWLPAGGLVMVFGKRGVGKSFFVASLAASLTTGTAFLRWGVDAPVGVLLVDGEMALSQLRDRIRDLVPIEPKAPLEICSHELVYNKTEMDLNLGDAEWQEAVNGFLADHEDIKVVVIDNLSCLLPTVPEDKRDDWAERVLPFLVGLRRRGVTVIMVHHAGKGGDQRGTSSREDSLDTIIKLEAFSDSDATTGAQFLVKFTKNRGVYGEEVADIEAQLGTGPDGSPLWSWKSIDESNEGRVLALVRDGVTQGSEIADELGLSKGAVSKIKRRLIAKGCLAEGREFKLAEGA